MAEWGQGDPRWIVEQRADGKNVNAWHWEEKDSTAWVKEHVAQDLFVAPLSAVREQPKMSVKVTRVSIENGEVTWYNRKGKLFTLYDVELKMPFTGTFGEDDIKGTIKCPEFEQDQEEDAEFNISITSGPSEVDYKKWLRSVVKPAFILQWKAMISALHEAKIATKPQLKQAASTGKLKLEEYKQPKAQVKTSSIAEAKKDLPCSISMTYTFQAAPDDLWGIFTDAKKAQFFTRSAVKMDAKEGGFFQMYDETISGVFLELKPYTNLKLSWRLKDWKAGVNSTVSVKLTKTSGGTRMELTQANVPRSEKERVMQGWRNYYWEPVKAVFGYSYK